MPLPYMPLPHMPLPYMPLPYMPLPHMPLPYMPLPYMPLPYMPLPYMPLPYMPLPTCPSPTCPSPTCPSPTCPSLCPPLQYIISRLNQLSCTRWNITLDSFSDHTPLGVKPFTNIVATLDPAVDRRLVIAAHYDSKLLTPVRGKQFLGATDSALPVALLLDLIISLDDKLQKRGVRRSRDMCGTIPYPTPPPLPHPHPPPSLPSLHPNSYQSILCKSSSLTVKKRWFRGQKATLFMGPGIWQQRWGKAMEC